MSTAKRLTPNKIANLVMADEAWHDSEYVAASDYDALSAELAAERERADKAEAEVARLNKWADGMTDAVLKERETGDMYQRELRAERDALRAELAALRAELQKVRSAAISGMDAATQHGHSLVQQAARLKAESNPDALESERAANALLTEQLQKAEADLAALRAERDALRAAGKDALHALTSSRVFVTSRERCHHPDGTAWYDERVERLRAALGER